MSRLNVGVAGIAAAEAAAAPISPATRQRTRKSYQFPPGGANHEPCHQQADRVVANVKQFERRAENQMLAHLGRGGETKNRQHRKPLVDTAAGERQQQQSQHSENDDMLDAVERGSRRRVPYDVKNGEPGQTENPENGGGIQERSGAGA